MYKAVTGFADGAFLKTVDSYTVSYAAFYQFFIPNGFPILVVFDAGSEFAEAIVGMCKLLRISHAGVAPANHKAVRNKRFHRFFNKVERINTAEASLTKLRQAVKLAPYAWNASPTDSTNICQAFAAKAHKLSFPVEIDAAAGNPNFDQAVLAMEHIDTAFPLLFRNPAD